MWANLRDVVGSKNAAYLDLPGPPRLGTLTRIIHTEGL